MFISNFQSMSLSARLYPSYFAFWIWKKLYAAAEQTASMSPNKERKRSQTHVWRFDTESVGIKTRQLVSLGIFKSAPYRRDPSRDASSSSPAPWTYEVLPISTCELSWQCVPNWRCGRGGALEAETQRIKTKSFSKFFKSSAGDSKCHSEVDPKPNGI